MKEFQRFIQFHILWDQRVWSDGGDLLFENVSSGALLSAPVVVLTDGSGIAIFFPFCHG